MLCIIGCVWLFHDSADPCWSVCMSGCSPRICWVPASALSKSILLLLIRPLYPLLQGHYGNPWLSCRPSVPWSKRLFHCTQAGFPLLPGHLATQLHRLNLYCKTNAQLNGMSFPNCHIWVACALLILATLGGDLQMPLHQRPIDSFSLFFQVQSHYHTLGEPTKANNTSFGVWWLARYALICWLGFSASRMVW